MSKWDSSTAYAATSLRARRAAVRTQPFSSSLETPATSWARASVRTRSRRSPRSPRSPGRTSMNSRAGRATSLRTTRGAAGSGRLSFATQRARLQLRLRSRGRRRAHRLSRPRYGTRLRRGLRRTRPAGRKRGRLSGVPHRRRPGEELGRRPRALRARGSARRPRQQSRLGHCVYGALVTPGRLPTVYQTHRLGPERSGTEW